MGVYIVGDKEITADFKMSYKIKVHKSASMYRPDNVRPLYLLLHALLHLQSCFMLLTSDNVNTILHNVSEILWPEAATPDL